MRASRVVGLPHLADHLGSATEAAARALWPLVGQGDPVAIDAAAVAALREFLRTLPAAAVVVASEGAKDRAPMLAVGECAGDPRGPPIDLAVDPVDGTRAAAHGRTGAIVAIGAAPRGALLAAGQSLYLEKIAVGQEAAAAIDLEAPLADNLRWIAAARGKQVSEVAVAVLARQRNAPHRRAVEANGARLVLVEDADLAPAVAVGLAGSALDAAIGLSGAPETILAACALRCLGGQILARDGTGGRVLEAAEMARGDEIMFAATGVTDSLLLDGLSRAGTTGGAVVAHTLILARGQAPIRRRR